MSAPAQQRDERYLAGRQQAAANLAAKPHLRDDGPPHRELLCLVDDGITWLCRYPGGNGHPTHHPYVEGEYLR